VTGLRVLLARLFGVFRRDDARLDEEIRAHLDLLAAERINQGLSPDQADAAAHREFGGADQAKERYRDQRGLPLVDHVVQDVRFAVRAVRRAPLFSAIAILTLAAGIGANAAMFSVADALVLRPLPVERPGELRAIHSFIALGGRSAKSSMSLPYAMFETLRGATDVVRELTAFNELDEIPLAFDGAEPRPASAAFVANNYFTMLGVRMRLGGGFSADVGTEVVVSDRTWRTTLNADPLALGRVLRIGTGVFTVVGVLDPEFTGVVVGRAPDLFLALEALPAAQAGIVVAEDSRFWRVNVVGRLAPGIADRAAGERLTTIARAAPIDPQAPPATIEALPLETALSSVRTRFLQPVQVLMAMVGMLLVVACTNVALMLLSRNSARRAEMATRTAIGAGRARLVQQLMTEGAVLALAAAGLALLIAPAAARAIVRALPVDGGPLSVRVAVDGRVLLFTAAISTLTVLLAATVPAFRIASAARHGSWMRRTNATGRGDARLGGSLVVAQIALAVTMVAGAGLLVRSLGALSNVDPGFDAARVVQVSVSPESRGYNGAQLVAYYRDLVARFAALPGVESVSFSQNGLLSSSRTTGTLDVPGFTPASDEERWVQVFQVGPRFFETYGMSPITGGDFTDAHMSGARVLIVNEQAARRFFGGRDPRGTQVAFGGGYEVMGIVRDARVNALREEAGPTVFMPYGQTRPRGALVFAVRTTSPDQSGVAAIARAAHDADALVPIRIMPLERVRAASIGRDRLLATMSSLFAAAALALLAIGLVGLLSFRVQQRTTEIGVRLALGATAGQVIWLMLRHPFRLAVAGLAAGITLSLATTGLLRSLLFGLSPTDASTLAGAATAVMLLVIASACIPAWRASRMDPVVALRQE
jgi:predicted permease